MSGELEGWAAYAAEQERHAETTTRLERLRDGVAYLHDVYAVAPNEPRCCSDCAANDISVELRRLLADTADPAERVPLARLKESNPARWGDLRECGHKTHEDSASNVDCCVVRPRSAVDKALADVHRHFCMPDAHDDACRVLHEWSYSVCEAEGNA